MVVRDNQVLIIGGGLSGLSLASALGCRGVGVTLIEAGRYAPQDTAGDTDLRHTAVSYGSQRLMERWGVWDEVKAYASPIMHVCVADGESGAFQDNRLTFSASHMAGVDRLGSIIGNDVLRRCMYSRARSYQSVCCVEGVAVARRRVSRDGVVLDLSDGREVRGMVVAVADGRFSRYGRESGIGYRHYDYEQKAVVALLRHERPHHGVAVEFFWQQGTVALLPMTDDEEGRPRSSLVWSLSQRSAEAMVSCASSLFASHVERYSHRIFGKMTLISERQAWRVSLVRAQNFVAERMALVGDACRALHPLAGQGINLGWRDVEVFAQLVQDYQACGLDCGSSTLLRTYGQRRVRDSQALMMVTHSLQRLFTRGHPALIAMRRRGLRMVESSPRARQFFMRHAMGLGLGLGRGLSVDGAW
ncbi:MAG: FAD-dependent monooxygenase [Alphaproteobacteria bacterium GM7ARS4]|nr:FAD-dependent monooxygenase [Alphaproteobacteria bacterium GM7ARS4]